MGSIEGRYVDSNGSFHASHSSNANEKWLAVLGRNSQGRDDKPPLLAPHNGDFGQVAELLESQALVDSPGGVIVVEVHAQKRGHAQPRTLADDELLESPPNAAAMIRAGDDPALRFGHPDRP